MRTKFFHPEHEKLNQFSNGNQTKIKRKILKFKPQLNHKLKQNFQKLNRNPRKNFQNQIQPPEQTQLKEITMALIFCP